MYVQFEYLHIYNRKSQCVSDISHFPIFRFTCTKILGISFLVHPWYIKYMYICMYIGKYVGIYIYYMAKQNYRRIDRNSIFAYTYILLYTTMLPEYRSHVRYINWISTDATIDLLRSTSFNSVLPKYLYEQCTFGKMLSHILLR